MREFWALVKRELKAIKREKTIMFAIFIQLFIASFSSFMLVGIMAFYDPDSMGDNTALSIDVGVVGETSSPIVYFADRSRNVRVNRYADIEIAESEFRYRYR